MGELMVINVEKESMAKKNACFWLTFLSHKFENKFRKGLEITKKRIIFAVYKYFTWLPITLKQITYEKNIIVYLAFGSHTAGGIDLL